MKYRNWRIALLIALSSFTFFLFFMDGYFQPINPDSFLEASSADQNMKFPEMLLAGKMHHSRWAAVAFPYVSYHVIPPIYQAFGGDKAESLFVTQGIMFGLTYAILLGLSAYYISLSSGFLSLPFFAGYIIFLAFACSSGYQQLDKAFLFRLYHGSGFGNYIFSFTLLLIVFLPYWRSYFTSKWDDWYGKEHLRLSWFIMLVIVAFSSTCTTIIVGILSGVILLLAFITDYYNSNDKKGLTRLLSSIPIPLKPFNQGLYLMLSLTLIAIFSERSGGVGMETHSFLSLSSPMHEVRDYIYIWREYFFHGRNAKALLAACVTLVLVSVYWYFEGNLERKRTVGKFIFISLLLLIIALPYSFLIGGVQLIYRYRGTNLGGDTVFFVTWAIVFIISSGIIILFRLRWLKLVLPLLVFAVLTHSLDLLSYHPFYHMQQVELADFKFVEQAENYTLGDTILLPRSDGDVICAWGTPTSRFSKFAKSVKLTTRYCNFELVDDSLYYLTYKDIPDLKVRVKAKRIIPAEIPEL